MPAKNPITHLDASAIREIHVITPEGTQDYESEEDAKRCLNGDWGCHAHRVEVVIAGDLRVTLTGFYLARALVHGIAAIATEALLERIRDRSSSPWDRARAVRSLTALGVEVPERDMGTYTAERVDRGLWGRLTPHVFGNREPQAYV